MPNLKPKFDGRGAHSQFYDGPPPTPGPYRGIIKGAWVGKVKTGLNEGADKILLRLEIDHGRFKGASLLTNLVMTQKSAWSINQFLLALCPNGTKDEADVLEELFWVGGLKIKDESETEGKLGIPIVSIGGKFGVVGKSVGFVIKMDEYNGETRPVVDRFTVNMNNDAVDKFGEEEEEEEIDLETEIPVGGDKFLPTQEEADAEAERRAERAKLPPVEPEDPWR